MLYEFIFSGIGGQGILLAGQLLCKAAVKKRHLVTWAPTYGQEKRGGRTMCQVVISDEVGSPVISEADIVLVMDEKSLQDFEGRVKASGYLIVNSSLVKTQPTRTDIKVAPVPVTEMAERIGNTKTANMVALGAFARYFGFIPLKDLQAELESVFVDKPKVLELNKAAMQAGFDYSAN
jgi:2-oxoglutarate ferredoxin oxidoreductase subunit gamma